LLLFFNLSTQTAFSRIATVQKLGLKELMV